jgi:hypothetical protein
VHTERCAQRADFQAVYRRYARFESAGKFGGIFGANSMPDPDFDRPDTTRACGDKFRETRDALSATEQAATEPDTPIRLDTEDG